MSVSGFKFFEQEYRSSGVQEFRRALRLLRSYFGRTQLRSDLTGLFLGYNPLLSTISVAYFEVGLEALSHSSQAELLNSSILNFFQAFAHYVYSVLIRRRLLVRPLLRIGTL